MSSVGRPRGPSATTVDTVLGAAFRLLVAEGPSALTAVRLSRETGVARTTIHRHWPTSRRMVEDILAGATARHELDELTGDLAHDLSVAVATLTRRFEHRPVVEFYRATVAVDRSGEEPSLSQRYIAGLIEPVRDVLQAGVDRGDLVHDLDVGASSVELCGPLLVDHVMLGQPVDQRRLEARLEAFLVANARG